MSKPIGGGYQDDLDRPLSPVGRGQAGRRRESLGNPTFSGIFCSPARRTKETAMIVGGVEESALVTVPELCPGDPANGGDDLVIDETFNAIAYAPASTYRGRNKPVMNRFGSNAWGRLESLLFEKPGEKLIVGHAVLQCLAAMPAVYGNRSMLRALLGLNMDEAGMFAILFRDRTPAFFSVLPTVNAPVARDRRIIMPATS